MIPKWMQKLNNHLPIEGKKSYVCCDRSFWCLVDENGNEIYRASRKNWVYGYIRKNWDLLK